jgi:1,2-phenylacetyl-CoA epoxidase catalytic subunit
MSYQPADTGSALDPDFGNDLLAVADTKLVLGNWYAECVMNGRSLPDFAAILGMCTTNYGHTRALYQYLAGHGHDYAHLERGRGGGDIRSMNLLDEAPVGWEDLLVATWLAELATWMLMSGFLGHPDRAIAGLARKIGEETYFHLKYAHGWMRIVGDGKRERRRFVRDFEKRYPLALQWFGPPRAVDRLAGSGLRDVPLAKLRQAFAREAAAAAEKLGTSLKLAKTVAMGKGWRRDARREGALPAGLFEVIRFKDSEIAH